MTGHILNYNENNYDVILSNGYYVCNIPKNNIEICLYKEKCKVYVVNEKQECVEGEITKWINEYDYTITITDSKKLIENLDLNCLKPKYDFNFKVSDSVLIRKNKNNDYSIGNIVNMKYDKKDCIKFGIYFSDNTYLEDIYDNILPFKKNECLYEICDDIIINKSNERGNISKINKDNTYNIHTVNGNYYENVKNEDIRINNQSLYNNGDIVEINRNKDCRIIKYNNIDNSYIIIIIII